jgi:hypothetical protein
MGGRGWEEMGGGWEARTIELKKVRFAGGGMTARYFLSGLMASEVYYMYIVYQITLPPPATH